MSASGVHGLLVGLALIVAIGAQNAFVLRQGLRRQHGWLVAGICAVCDLLLIAAGVAGLGPLLTTSDALLATARWAGAAWLIWQALAALRRIRRPAGLMAAGGVVSGRGRVVAATLAVTLLNPHVYLDTVVMLGILGSQQASPVAFVLGAALASIGWFFALVGVGHWLAPRLEHPRWWQAIDAVVAAVMLWMALRLATGPI
ncbi:LysE/ArgO family amino acid transporter [Salinicola rhizosphaerae]|uniref:Transporter n=1 Tax=Salinicola rhizosphaerae TaxID=1443141 RepID=A0ABQ3E5G7_9GAMM|nr:LysE family transporter [Salinicola rhizosphaerae]GHB27140.1 transporter [Salinicola rhizosphaerae]